MPTSYRGIGTHYYGKEKLESHEGRCDQCGKETTLNSYETTLYFVIFYLPAISLGRKQILNMCPFCDGHLAIDLQEWERIRTEEIDRGLEDLANDQTSSTKAIDLLQTLTEFKQMSQAAELTSAMKASFPRDFDAQFAVGRWHEKYGEQEIANACFAQVVDIDVEHPLSIRIKGIELMERGNLDQARELLAVLLPPSEYYDPEVFISLACRFQDKQQHDVALQKFALVLHHDPDYSLDKSFRSMVRKSELAIGKRDSMVKVRLFDHPLVWIPFTITMFVLIFVTVYCIWSL